MSARTGVFQDVDLVIFDFDGVIADSEVISLSTLRDTLADFGIPLTLESVRDRFLGTSLKTVSAFMRDQGVEDPAHAFPDIWRRALYQRFRQELTPIPDVMAFIDRLNGVGLRSCIASSGSLERIGIALETMALKNRFQDIFSSEQVARGKPAPDIFFHAAAQMTTAPERCLVIEDSPYGVIAAKSAGMRAVGFVGGAHLHDITTAHGDLLTANGAERVWQTFQEATAALG